MLVRVLKPFRYSPNGIITEKADVGQELNLPQHIADSVIATNRAESLDAKVLEGRPTLPGPDETKPLMPIEEIKGLGASKAAILRETFGIESVEDLAKYDVEQVEIIANSMKRTNAAQVHDWMAQAKALTTEG